MSDTGCSEQDIPTAVVDGGGPKGLLKWKGVVLFPDGEGSSVAASVSMEEVEPGTSQYEPPSQLLTPPPPPDEPPQYQVSPPRISLHNMYV